MKRARAGFGLIELLTAMVIMTLLIAAIMSLYSKGQQAFINEGAKNDAVEESRFPMAWISRDVKLAAAVDAAWGGYTTSAATLVLRVPSVDGDGAIIDSSTTWDRIVYTLQDGRLLRIVDAQEGVSSRVDASRVLADGISAVAFAYFDSAGVVLTSNFGSAASVKPSITAVRTGARRTFQESLESEIKLRNIDGVESAEASHEKGSAVVRYDPTKVTPDRIVSAIEDLGYKVKLVETKSGGRR